ncbi:MAG: hypothetical protein V7603_5106 [Micromonosporaceae bacterium]
MIDTKVDVHWVCCDANVALCGATLTGGAQYHHDVATCVLCELAASANLPCAAPGCDVGQDEDLADIAALLRGQCRVCGCTDDDSCPGGCRWVDDPTTRGELCSACLRAAGARP